MTSDTKSIRKKTVFKNYLTYSFNRLLKISLSLRYIQRPGSSFWPKPDPHPWEKLIYLKRDHVYFTGVIQEIHSSDRIETTQSRKQKSQKKNINIDRKEKNIT